jgi:hypothetical protein
VNIDLTHLRIEDRVFMLKVGTVAVGLGVPGDIKAKFFSMIREKKTIPF